MSNARTFLMAGGGTGGHVVPLLAVARELRSRGQHARFIGTRQGLEARLVPQAGFEIDWIEIGGLKSVGLPRTLKTLRQLPAGVLQVLGWISKHRPAAVFSMGGYVAGPVMLAAWLRRVPTILMEPNAIPGMTNRRMGRYVARALVNFEVTMRYFPPGRAEVAGLPVRHEFFALPSKPRGETLAVLITGGSRGSRTLNNAARESWRLFRESGLKIRILHQTGADAFDSVRADFAAAGLLGEVLPFIEDMPAAFARADIVVCRSGAGAVAEVAAAGKPAILVPFPFATDDHQLHNARALAATGAARLVLDREMDGRRLFEEISALAAAPAELDGMAAEARKFAKPDAASRAADLLEELAQK